VEIRSSQTSKKIR